MRSVALAGIVTFISVLCLASVSNAAYTAEKMFVEVRKPFANVYKELDPKSEIIEQAKKGDHLELVFEGTSWYHVKVRDHFGWIEKRAGEITNNPGGVSVFSIILLVLLIGGTIGAVSFYIYKGKLAGA